MVLLWSQGYSIGFLNRWLWHLQEVQQDCLAPYQLQSSPQRKVSKGKYYIPRVNTWSQETCQHGFFLMATRPGAITIRDWCVGIWPNCTGKFFCFILILSLQLNYTGHYMLIWMSFSVIFLLCQWLCAWRATTPFLLVVCATFKVSVFFLHVLPLIILLSTMTISLV